MTEIRTVYAQFLGQAIDLKFFVGMRFQLKGHFVSQDFDYDWADESIHLQYGHKWLLHRLQGDIDALEDLKEDTLAKWDEWIRVKHTEWDYEPFKSRMREKIEEMEDKLHV